MQKHISLRMATTLQSIVERNNMGFDKTRSLVELHDKRYYVIDWDTLRSPIVYDENMHDAVKDTNWSVFDTFYAQHRAGGGTYMHHHILKTATGTDPRVEGMTVDHINEFKLDNRLANLRIASQSQQNSNRATRSDRLPPPAELQAVGIQECPRHVRWDRGEAKFVIEKHPALLKRVADNKQKKPVMSGSKSAKLTVVQKYQDILAKLKELDVEAGFATAEAHDFAERKKQLGDEYMAIVRAVRGPEFPDPRPSATMAGGAGSSGVEAARAAPPGRKKPSNLPADCGVTVDMLPPCTYYMVPRGTNGDRFCLDIGRGPGAYRWASTSSKTVTTKDKYEELMEHIAQLPAELRAKLGV